jgi:hypothetical protein
MVIVPSKLSLNKALSSKACIILGFILSPERLLTWDKDITLPLFMNDDLLNVPKTIYIIPQYVLDSNHWLSLQEHPPKGGERTRLSKTPVVKGFSQESPP